MATIVFPTGLRTGPVDYAIEFDVQISVSRNGRIFTYGLPGARWTCTLTFENELEQMQRPAIEALIVSLEGGANRLQMGHLARPVPNGTLRGSPTLASNVNAGASSLPMTNCNGTVKKGDILGVSGQNVMVMEDATPSGNNMTVAVKPAIRAARTSGTAVEWNKPAVLWIPKSSTAGPFPYLQNKVRPAFSIELVEAP